jgi:hypothetical protein
VLDVSSPRRAAAALLLGGRWRASRDFICRLVDDGRRQTEKDVFEPLAAGPKVTKLQIVLSEPRGKFGHQRRNGGHRD